MDSLLFGALEPLLEAFDELGIEYQLGGSAASSFHGEPRASQGIDVLAGLEPDQMVPLVEKLKPHYRVAQRAGDGVARGTSFEIVHMDTMTKVDVFVARSDRFRLESLRRGKPAMLPEGQRPVFMTSAEDIVLHKLFWFRKGRETSAQQWKDVIGVLRARGPELDREYLESWALELEVKDLLNRAWSEATSGFSAHQF
jgi:hypothetical protein